MGDQRHDQDRAADQALRDGASEKIIHTQTGASTVSSR